MAYGIYTVLCAVIIKNMITWNIDPTNYTQEQLEELLSIVEKMDSSIAKEIVDYLVNTYST